MSARGPRRVPPGLWERPELAGVLAARDVGAMFRALMWEGMSQVTIAELTGMRQSDVSEIQGGRRRVGSLTVLRRVVDGLGVPYALVRLADADPASRPLTPPPLVDDVGAAATAGTPERMTVHSVPAGLWERPEVADILAARDVAGVFRVLQREGMSQRTIGKLTGQSLIWSLQRHCP